MFRFKKIITIILVATIVSGLVSCDDDTTDKGDIQVIGDAFILKRKIDEKIQYAYTYYLYANFPMSSASVTTPDQELIPLAVSDQLSLEFSKEPLFEDYTENIPQSGLFHFNAKYIDTDYNTTDNLTFIDMAIPEITSTEYFYAAETLKVDWNTVPEADSYIVRMIDGDNNVFFTGYLLDEDATSYEINQQTGTWLELPNYDQRFVLEIHASRYVQDIDELELYYIEEVSICEETINWGVN